MTKLAKQSEPLKVEQWPTEKVVPYARNPRKNEGIPVAKVKASLKEFGWRQPIVVDSEGVIIVGHTRYQAALELGMTEIPVHVAEGLTAAQVKAYRIADNKTGDFAEWDFDLLKLEFADLQELDFGLDLTGFDGGEVDGIMVDSTPEGLTDPDEVPDVPDEPVSKPGDVWVMGNHRLMCGDSTVATDVERLLGKVKPHLMVTDPPYGVNVVGNSGTIGGSVKAKNKKYEKVIGDDAPFDPAFLFSICSEGVVFGANYFPHSVPSIGQWIVWDKGRPAGTTFSDAELAWTSGRGVAVKAYRCVWNGMTREGESGERVHPTQKPIKLFCDIINDFADAGAVIFEPFSGSGTTIIAAEKTSRVCYAMELSPAYIDVAVKRWEDFTGKKAVLEVTNAEG